MQGGPAGWPILSAETLWRFQYAGLHHMIRRGDLLAERWLAALEAAARIVRGPVLGIPDATLTATELAQVVNGFARLRLSRGQPKAGEDWAAVTNRSRMQGRAWYVVGAGWLLTIAGILGWGYGLFVLVVTLWAARIGYHTPGYSLVDNAISAGVSLAIAAAALWSGRQLRRGAASHGGAHDRRHLRPHADGLAEYLRWAALEEMN